MRSLVIARAAVPPGGPAAAAGAPLFSGLAAMTALLEARGLTKHFGGVVALDRLDLAVAPNEILGLIGPNGSGKTTFFNVVTGIYGADAGQRHLRRRRHHQRRAARRLSGRHLAHLPALAAVAAAVDLRQHHDRQPQAPQSGPVVQPDAARRTSSANSRRAIAAARALVDVFEPALADRMFEPVAGLPMIDRRRIEICRALISAAQAAAARRAFGRHDARRDQGADGRHPAGARAQQEPHHRHRRARDGRDRAHHRPLRRAQFRPQDRRGPLPRRSPPTAQVQEAYLGVA